MAPKLSSSFYEEVWRHLEDNVKTLQSKEPGGQTPEVFEKTMKKAEMDLEKSKAARNLPFNLARLADPSQPAIPEDLLEMSMVRKSGKFYFFDQEHHHPKAPVVWPMGKNVPLFTYSAAINKEGPFEHFGNCSIIAGFFWDWAETLKNPDWKSLAEGFEALCVNASADFQLIATRGEADILAFNVVEGNEEARENDGFTGIRKALLVMYAARQVAKAKKGDKWRYDDVAKWLKLKIKFHDEKHAPSVATCRDLYEVGRDFLQNKRASAAYQEAEMEWGRSTFFDEYSKLLVLIQKSRDKDDLAFMAEFLLAEMQTHPAPQVPENFSQTRLKAIGGPTCVAQASRDALRWLLRGQAPPTWGPFASLLKDLCSPSRFRKLFPAGSQTPETTVQLLVGCPSSLKQAICFIRSSHERHGPWTAKLKGYSNKARAWTVPDSKWAELFAVFGDEWAAYTDICREESGKDRAPNGEEGGGQESVGDGREAAGKTAVEDVVPVVAKSHAEQAGEIAEKAKEKARAVCIDPGLVIVRDAQNRWDKAALQTLMKAQVVLADQGAFTAFWFCDSDQEVRVHPGQNRCLRYAPCSKARLGSFCEGVDSIMEPGRDSCVIDVGRAVGNRAVVEDAVDSMKWPHEEIRVCVDRSQYDEFVKSGTLAKKKRIHRGLATCKNGVAFLCAGSKLKEGRRSRSEGACGSL